MKSVFFKNNKPKGLYTTIYYYISRRYKMTKIQIDLSEKEDKIVEIFKLVNNFKTKEEAIKKMILKFNVNVAVNLSDQNYKQAIKFTEDKK